MEECFWYIMQPTNNFIGQLSMLYRTECYAIKKQYITKINAAEMRMLRWMCGKTRKDRVRYEYIRESRGGPN